MTNECGLSRAATCHLSAAHVIPTVEAVSLAPAYRCQGFRSPQVEACRSRTDPRSCCSTRLLQRPLTSARGVGCTNAEGIHQGRPGGFEPPTHSSRLRTGHLGPITSAHVSPRQGTERALSKRIQCRDCRDCRTSLIPHPAQPSKTEPVRPRKIHLVGDKTRWSLRPACFTASQGTTTPPHSTPLRVQAQRLRKKSKFNGRGKSPTGSAGPDAGGKTFPGANRPSPISPWQGRIGSVGDSGDDDDIIPKSHLCARPGPTQPEPLFRDTAPSRPCRMQPSRDRLRTRASSFARASTHHLPRHGSIGTASGAGSRRHPAVRPMTASRAHPTTRSHSAWTWRHAHPIQERSSPRPGYVRSWCDIITIVITPGTSSHKPHVSRRGSTGYPRPGAAACGIRSSPPPH